VYFGFLVFGQVVGDVLCPSLAVVTPAGGELVPRCRWRLMSDQPGPAVAAAYTPPSMRPNSSAPHRHGLAFSFMALPGNSEPQGSAVKRVIRPVSLSPVENGFGGGSKRR
jgi:hypothetical protein